ncbi:MAG: nitroreductase family protein [Planctomycetes bacterium]|nr:nitroreductase family protein [Planctomycetota bacterium]
MLPADPPPDADEALAPLDRDAEAAPPAGALPEVDFWSVLYGRRSIRRFDERPVPRALVDRVLHAGTWAPSSCNYQMWDVVAVDDPAINADLAALSTQMGNAPVNLVVSYGREFSEEGWANVQSASAMVQNMSLAAEALGLGTFWITQMGDREKVRERVGLPHDRLVIAVLALGYPKSRPKSGPKRRPLTQVTHYNQYAGEPVPSSPRPEDWRPELLTLYQRARVLNGLRHNKPRAWETRALLAALATLVPEPPADEGAAPRRWLDVLPCTGILTERLARERKGWAFDVVERSPEVAAFVAERTRPKGAGFAWPTPAPGFASPAAGAYQRASCLFRLEDLAPADRGALLADVATWLAPGGELLLGYVSKRSFHETTEALRRRRGGPRGVEYVLSPDPNIGPFEALEPGEVDALLARAGFVVEGRLGLQAVPQPEELEFRTRNFSPRARAVARFAARALGLLERLPGVQARRGRFQFVLARRGTPPDSPAA